MVFVSGTLDDAIKILGRKIKGGGLEKELRVRSFPKRSERIRYKKHLANNRRLKNDKRREARER